MGKSREKIGFDSLCDFLKMPKTVNRDDIKKNSKLESDAVLQEISSHPAIHVKVFCLDGKNWRSTGLKGLLEVSEACFPGCESSSTQERKSINLKVRNEQDGSELMHHLASRALNYTIDNNTVIRWFEMGEGLAISFQNRNECKKIFELLCSVTGEFILTDSGKSFPRASSEDSGSDGGLRILSKRNRNSSVQKRKNRSFQERASDEDSIKYWKEKKAELNNQETDKTAQPCEEKNSNVSGDEAFRENSPKELKHEESGKEGHQPVEGLLLASDLDSNAQKENITESKNDKNVPRKDPMRKKGVEDEKSLGDLEKEKNSMMDDLNDSGNPSSRDPYSNNLDRPGNLPESSRCKPLVLKRVKPIQNGDDQTIKEKKPPLFSSLGNDKVRFVPAHVSREEDFAKNLLAQLGVAEPPLPQDPQISIDLSIGGLAALTEKLKKPLLLSPAYKKAAVRCLNNDEFMSKARSIFEKLEDINDYKSLELLFSVFKGILGIELLFDFPENVMGALLEGPRFSTVVSIFEYSPTNIREAKKQNKSFCDDHRSFLKRIKAKNLPLDLQNEELVTLGRELVVLTYLRDVVLAGHLSSSFGTRLDFEVNYKREQVVESFWIGNWIEFFLLHILNLCENSQGDEKTRQSSFRLSVDFFIEFFQNLKELPLDVMLSNFARLSINGSLYNAVQALLLFALESGNTNLFLRIQPIAETLSMRQPIEFRQFLSSSNKIPLVSALVRGVLGGGFSEKKTNEKSEQYSVEIVMQCAQMLLRFFEMDENKLIPSNGRILNHFAANGLSLIGDYLSKAEEKIRSLMAFCEQNSKKSIFSEIEEESIYQCLEILRAFNTADVKLSLRGVYAARVVFQVLPFLRIELGRLAMGAVRVLNSAAQIGDCNVEKAFMLNDVAEKTAQLIDQNLRRSAGQENLMQSELLAFVFAVKEAQFEEVLRRWKTRFSTELIAAGGGIVKDMLDGVERRMRAEKEKNAYEKKCLQKKLERSKSALSSEEIYFSEQNDDKNDSYIDEKRAMAKEIANIDDSGFIERKPKVNQKPKVDLCAFSKTKNLNRSTHFEETKNLSKKKEVFKFKIASLFDQALKVKLAENKKNENK